MSLRMDGASRAAMDTLVAQGIREPKKPGYDLPELPRDLTSVGDEDLMVLYSEYTAYSDFVGVQVSCAQVDERSLEKRISSLESMKMLASKANGGAEKLVTYAKAAVAQDPQVVKLKEELEVVYAYRKLIESLSNNLDRDSNLISRELTRRTSSSNRKSNRWAP